MHGQEPSDRAPRERLGLEYHLAELAIAVSDDDPRRVLPDAPVAPSSILDVGCGAGQSLIAMRLGPGIRRVGVDIDRGALAAGRKLDPSLLLICADGACLPFRDGQFDLVFSRVSVPYMRLPQAITEFRRLLAPRGRVWLTLHSARLSLSPMIAGIRRLKWKPVIYGLYVAVNGALLHCLGRTVPFPLNPSRCESFQTLRGMQRVLVRCGIRVRRSSRRPHFLIEGDVD